MKKTKIIYIVLILMLFLSCIYASSEDSEDKKISTQEVTKGLSDSLELNDYVSTIDDYVKTSGLESIDMEDISKELFSSGKINYNGLISKVIGVIAKEVVNSLGGAISIFIIVIIMAIIQSVELEHKSDVTKIAHLVCFLALATITIATFVDVISVFKNVVTSLTTIMQVIAPFLMAVLIATGAITTTGIIQPLILFIASAIGFLVTYLIVPFFTISIAFNVISSLSENLRLGKMSKWFSSSAIWIFGVVLTVFLGILSLESSLTSSVDALAVKTTQAAVSNFVPVVGKFFSDSFETVVGATQVVGKVGGTLGVIAIIVVALVPVIKIASIFGIYSILSAVVEPIYSDDNISKYLSGFANVYKNLLGILIGISILFIISSGIILNLVSNIVK